MRLTNGRKTIAVLFDYLQGDYQTSLRSALEAEARARGVDLLLFVGRPLAHADPLQAAQNEVYERLIGTPIDGLILASASVGSVVGPDGLHTFGRRFAHLPTCSVSMQVPGVPSVIVDNRQGTRAVVDHLIVAHGCRRLAYIRGPANNSEADERFDAFRESLDTHGLVLDPELVTDGNFWVDDGAAAAVALLARGKPFDALVAANDHMALGALDALRARGVNVPQDLLVAGFDDVPSAVVASPSLTTVKQPIAQLGRAALTTVLLQTRAEEAPLLQQFPVELVTRQSCGCAYHLRGAADLLGRAAQSARSVDLEDRELRHSLLACVARPTEQLGRWPDELLQALHAELSGDSGRFLLALEGVLHRAQPHGDDVAQFNGVIAVLRGHFATRVSPERQRSIEDLWHAALLLVSSAVTRSHVRERFRLEHAQDMLQQTVARISTALGYSALAHVLTEVLPTLGIQRAAISLYDGAERARLRPLCVVQESPVEPSPFAACLLAPPGFFAATETSSYVVLPITFNTEQLGLAVLQSGQHALTYSMLREHIGAAVKAAALHRAVVEEASTRERAEREHLHKEVEIARQIQLGILPASTEVDGLELAGCMFPAADIGGDYYDVLPTPGGAWLAIGDVAGHGLFAGLVMLMIQSMVHGMVRSETPYAPSGIFNAVNAALWDNVKNRLHKDNHASLLLIRYERSGRLTFAGYHDDMIIWRARTRRCELVSLDGVWACAIEDTKELTTDSEVSLEDGDLLVLYTDGVTEAMNPQREQFGLQRLCDLVESHQQLAAAQICKAISDTALDWAAHQADDISVLVARYSAV